MNTRLPETPGRSWRALRQSVSGPAPTQVAARRRLYRWGRWVGRFGMAVLGFFAILYAGVVIADRPERLASIGSEHTLQKIAYETDGVLRSGWLENKLRSNGIRRGMPLMEIDIFLLRQWLLQEDQVLEAVVQRRHPDALHVRIEERQPVFRLVVDREGERETMVVATDGLVFRGEDYPESALRRLPFLAGVRLREVSDGYAPIERIDPVVRLWEQIRREHREFSRTVRVFDLSRLDPDPAMPYSAVIVRSTEVREIFFDPGDINRQLARLETILGIFQQQGIVGSRRIDLRFEDSVPVQISRLNGS